MVAPTVVRRKRCQYAWLIRTIVGVRSTEGNPVYLLCFAHRHMSDNVATLANHSTDKCRCHPTKNLQSRQTLQCWPNF